MGRDDAQWLRTTLSVHAGQSEVKFIREFDYDCAGQSIHVTDRVDTSLVRPRPRKYEQAGATHDRRTEAAEGGQKSTD